MKATGPAVLAASLIAATAAHATTTVTKQEISAILPHCETPKVSIIVGTFPCKATNCTTAANPQLPAGMAALMAMSGKMPPQTDFSHLGDTMGSALTTALKATNCFQVQDREVIEQLKKEADLSGIPFTPKASDYLITGAITAVALNTKSNTIGGGFIPVVGAIHNTTHNASMSLDVRLVNVKDGQISGSKTFDANSSRGDWALGAAGFGGGGGLFGTSSSTQSPELDSVANQAIVYAATYITETLAKDQITSSPPAAGNSATPGH